MRPSRWPQRVPASHLTEPRKRSSPMYLVANIKSSFPRYSQSRSERHSSGSANPSLLSAHMSMRWFPQLNLRHRSVPGARARSSSWRCRPASERPTPPISGSPHTSPCRCTHWTESSPNAESHSVVFLRPDLAFPHGCVRMGNAFEPRRYRAAQQTNIVRPAPGMPRPPRPRTRTSRPWNARLVASSSLASSGSASWPSPAVSSAASRRSRAAFHHFGLSYPSSAAGQRCSPRPRSRGSAVTGPNGGPFGTPPAPSRSRRRTSASA